MQNAAADTRTFDRHIGTANASVNEAAHVHRGHEATLADGRVVTPALFRQVLDEEMTALRQTLPAGAFEGGRFAEAIAIFTEMSLSDAFEEFLTLPAYRVL